MRRLGLILIGLLVACSTHPNGATTSEDPRLATAEAFIETFYSFDTARLRQAMTDARGSQPDILYYQQWAVGGNYVVLKRHPCRFDKPDEISCGVTVKDDLAPALGIPYHVTDVFHFAFIGDRIVKVWNSSDDPPEYQQAMQWLRSEQPEIFAGPCKRMWEGGPTPQDCVRAIVKGFGEFTAMRQGSGG